MKWLCSAVCVASLWSCRTSIRPVAEEKPEPIRSRQAGSGCEIQDFDMAAELPAGSKNLGWLRIPWAGDEDSSFAALRKKVCEMGGDALSQIHWLRPSGTSVAEPPTVLEANVWLLPQ